VFTVMSSVLWAHSNHRGIVGTGCMGRKDIRRQLATVEDFLLSFVINFFFSQLQHSIDVPWLSIAITAVYSFINLHSSSP
jgi:hypothetical protein